MTLYMGSGSPVNVLLHNEPQGFSVDATVNGGFVTVLDTTTPSNNRLGQLMDSSNLTQAGTSPKLVQWNTNRLQWTPHNYFTRSEEFDHADWTKGGSATITTNATIAPDGTTTAEKFIEPASSASPALTHAYTVTIGFTYTWSIYAKSAGNSRYLEFVGAGTVTPSECPTFNVDAGTVSVGGTTTVIKSATITAVGNGWYRCSAVLAPSGAGTLSFRLSDNSTDHAGTNYTGNGTSGLYLWGAHLHRGETLQPYRQTTSASWYGIPQGYDTTLAKFGMLIEPAATNLLYPSEDLSTVWQQTRVTVTSNIILAPDGSKTADKVVEASDTALTHNISNPNSSVTSGTFYVWSCYFKAAERTWVAMGASTARMPTNFGCSFDIANGVKGIPSAGTVISGIESVGNGWYRCYVGAAATGTGLNNFTVLPATGDGGITYNGDGTSGFYMWGGQVEASPSISPSTSYIPTVGATVTRAADNVNCNTSTFPYSATEGTVVLWGKARAVDYVAPTSPRWLTISDGTANESFGMGTAEGATPDTLKLDILDNSVAQVVGSVTQAGTVNLNGNKFAGFYKLNDSGVLVDGGSEVVDTVCTMPTVTGLYLGYRPETAARELNGYMYQMTYIPRRLTQAEMQKRTTT